MLPSSAGTPSSTSPTTGHPCRSAAGVLARASLDPTSPYAWLHFGPFTATRAPLLLHTNHTLTRRILGGGGVRKCDVPTWRAARPFVGFSLDLLLLLQRPPATLDQVALRLALADPPVSGAVVFARARRSEDGPYAQWQLRPDGTPELSYRFPGGRPPVATELHELASAAELILGGRRRPGRRPLYADPRARELAERAASLKARHPQLGYAQIAARLGLDERTLRRYRAASAPGAHPQIGLLLIHATDTREAR